MVFSTKKAIKTYKYNRHLYKLSQNPAGFRRILFMIAFLA
jgi:hypothetical protein